MAAGKTGKSDSMRWPQVVQGGMGIGVSGWQLAGAVSRTGQLGVVSGTALDFVVARRLQDGDPGGPVRRALAAFPDGVVARRVEERYYIAGGKSPDAPYKGVSLPCLAPRREAVEFLVVAGFVEVFLAKECADGAPVGINFLMKIGLPLVPTLYGAMLAGVDVVIAGAGSPKAVPAALDRLARHEEVSFELKVLYASDGQPATQRFAPREAIAVPLAPLCRPRCLAIVASNDLASDLAGAATPPDGFVIEGPTAGGHNAPPRGPLALSGEGEPRYGDRDAVDLEAIAALGLPFWLAGGFGSAEGLRRALEAGAAGVQVGTAFALCEESGMDPEIRAQLLEAARAGGPRVFTDPIASPTGFPFKVVSLPGSLSDSDVYEERPRVCDVGLLRAPFEGSNGTLGYRCPSEPERVFFRKRGLPRAVGGRMCLCNGLLATVGLGQVRKDGRPEPPLVTAGDDLSGATRFLAPGRSSYTAAEVVAALLAASEVRAATA